MERYKYKVEIIVKLEDDNNVELEQAIDVAVQEACENLVSQVEGIESAEYELADHRGTVFSEGQAE